MISWKKSWTERRIQKQIIPFEWAATRFMVDGCFICEDQEVLSETRHT